MGGIFKEMYECDDASVSSNSETLSLDVADGEISVKEVESAILRVHTLKSEILAKICKKNP